MMYQLPCGDEIVLHYYSLTIFVCFGRFYIYIILFSTDVKIFHLDYYVLYILNYYIFFFYGSSVAQRYWYFQDLLQFFGLCQEYQHNFIQNISTFQSFQRHASAVSKCVKLLNSWIFLNNQNKFLIKSFCNKYIYVVHLNYMELWAPTIFVVRNFYLD